MCPCCLNGIAPFQLRVDVENVVRRLGPCDDCELHNGTYYLDWITGADLTYFCVPAGASCAWGLEFDSICGRTKAHVAIGCNVTVVDVQFAIASTVCTSGTQWLRWWDLFAIAPVTFDCFFNGLELSYVSTTTTDCTTRTVVRLFAA